LTQIAAALGRLARRRAFELRIIAPEPAALQQLELDGVSVRFVPWRGESEVEEIRRFDIGVMPLPKEQEWTRYKCGLKLLQYMAVGMPAVASPVGVNADIVEHGVNGFLADGDAAWEQALERLLIDADLRRSIGTSARRTVAERYSVEVNLPHYLSAFERAIRHAG
jgi:glycosyltransferase involved in cell wall biosynthesis